MKTLVTATYVCLSTAFRSDRGANLLKYSLLLAFIALASIFAITQIGEKTLSNAASVLPGLNNSP